MWFKERPKQVLSGEKKKTISLEDVLFTQRVFFWRLFLKGQIKKKSFLDDCFSIEVYVELRTDKAGVQATAGTSKNLVLNLGVL